MSKKLHDVVEKSAWIEELVAGCGGHGGGQAYANFFSAMRNVSDMVREEVAWI